MRFVDRANESNWGMCFRIVGDVEVNVEARSLAHGQELWEFVPHFRQMLNVSRHGKSHGKIGGRLSLCHLAREASRPFRNFGAQSHVHRDSLRFRK